MRIDLKFKLREIAGEHLLVNQGTPEVNLTEVISLNESACFLFKRFAGKPFALEEVAEALMSKYGLSPAKAAKDAALWVKRMKQCEVIISD